VGILDLVFPKTCLGCGGEGTYICPDCVAKVKLTKPVCIYCERPSIDGATHIKCQRKFGLDGLISIWEYEGVVKKAILALKYKYSIEVGRELTSLFLQYLHNSLFLIPNSGFLVPIPLHWHRENVRGFNQSAELGKLVAEACGWQFASGLLIKKKSTASQVELKGDERRQNLRNVFALSSHNSLFIIPDSILLFDDVSTTGSTIMEAAKVLKRAGAKKVWGLTIAR
jgi:competence protein ComFC